MSQPHPSQNRRPLWSIVALGVPWMLGVGLLVAAERAQNGDWLTRNLIDLWSHGGSGLASAESDHQRLAPRARAFPRPPSPVQVYKWPTGDLPEPAIWVADVPDVPPVESAPVADAANLEGLRHTLRKLEISAAGEAHEAEIRAHVEKALAAVSRQDMSQLRELDARFSYRLRHEQEEAAREACSISSEPLRTSVDMNEG